VSERGTVLADLARDAYPFAIPEGPLPDPTPAEGPDPYGNPSPEWPGYDWVACLRRADVGGAEVVYVDAGSGEPAIVFVHGLSGSWQN
jgi:hypothetical protein